MDKWSMLHIFVLLQKSHKNVLLLENIIHNKNNSQKLKSQVAAIF